MRKKSYLLRCYMLTLLLFCSLLSFVAAAQKQISSKSFEIKKSRTIVLNTVLQADKQKQSRQVFSKNTKSKIEEFEERSGRKLNPTLRLKKEDGALQRQANTLYKAEELFLKGSTPPKPSLNFVGAELLEPGFFVTPPDVVGDVGTMDIVSLTNKRVKIFNKNNISDVFSFDIDLFFTLGLGTQTISSDPHVRFDRLTGKWFFCAISIDEDSSNRVLLAVSKGSNIKDTSSFVFYDFAYDISGGLDNLGGGFLDYPTLGVDAHSLLIGGNVFRNSYEGSISYVIDKKALLNGILRLNIFAGGDAGILFTPQGVQNDNGAERFSYFACVDNFFYSLLHILRVEYDKSGAVSSGTLYDIVSPTGPTYPVATKDAPVILDGLDDRFLAAMIMKNKITDESTLVTAHQFHMDANGKPSTTGGRLGVRWYEINNLTQTPTIKQKGTLVDTKCEQPFTFWNGSLAINGQGHMLLSASRSSQFTYPETVISGRLFCDAAGYTQPPLKVSTAKGPYDYDFFSILFGGERWGDYSQVVVDPTDNMTMWAFGEFGSNSESDTTYNWAVQVTQIKAPAPPKFKIEFDKKETDKIKIIGTANSCQGFFDPGAGYQKRLKVQILGANTIAVKKVNFKDPANIVLTVNDKQFVPGDYILVVTNPDGQSSFQTFSIAENILQANTQKVLDAEQLTTKELTIFPNPVNTKLTLQTNALLAGSNIQVYDLTGNIVMRKFAGENQTNISIDASKLANGTYFIQIKNSKETYINKFIVQH